MSNFTKKIKFIFALIAFAFFGLIKAEAQVFISNGQTVQENFDGIGTTTTASLPAGWKADKLSSVRTVGSYTAAVSATERAGGNNLATNAPNGIYNFGAGDAATATDRAIGFLSSSNDTKSGNLYLMLENNGTANINFFTISYDVEKYRRGTRAEDFAIQMHYSMDGTTWTDAGTDFYTAFPGGDSTNSGFNPAPGATQSVVNKDLNVIIPANSTLYLAWNYSVISGTFTSNAQALAINNVVIEAAAASVANDATLSSLSSSMGTLSPVFNPMTMNYTVLLPFGTTATPTVTAVPSNTLADVDITPAIDITSSTASDRTTTIVVTSEDLTETKTYTVEFNVPASVSDDASLSSITTSVGVLDPVFDATVMYYVVQLPYGVSVTPTITATPTYPYASVDITPAIDINSIDSLERTTTIEVMAEDSTTTETYLVQFNPTVLTFVDVSDIQELRTGATDGTLYRLTGEAVITFKQSYRNQKFVQDATAAILIDDFANVLNNLSEIGDGFTNLIGSLTLHNNMLQFIPEVNPGINSTGNIVTPVVKTVSQITLDDQAKLIKIINANFPAAVDTFIINNSYNLTDITGTIVFRTAFHTVDYIGTIVPTYNVDVTGIYHQYINTKNFTARNLADIEQATSIIETNNNIKIDVYPNPASEKMFFAFELPAENRVSLSISDINGKEIFRHDNTLSAGRHTITWENNVAIANGIYFYNLMLGNVINQGKLIITK